MRVGRFTSRFGKVQMSQDPSTDFVYDEATGEWVDPSAVVATSDSGGQPEVRDSVGNLLADGDCVTLIKDLKVKGSGGVTLKRGTLIRNIRLTENESEVECRAEKVKDLVLRTEFLKKA